MIIRLHTLHFTHGNQIFTFMNVSTAPFVVSSIVVPIYVRWFIDALVSTRNTIIVILTVLESAITSNHMYRGQESLKGLITSKIKQTWVIPLQRSYNDRCFFSS